MKGRTWVRSQVQPFCFSDVHIADPIHCLLARTPCVSKSHPLDCPLIRSSIQQAQNIMDPQKESPLNQALDNWAYPSGLQQFSFTPPVCFITPGPISFSSLFICFNCFLYFLINHKINQNHKKNKLRFF